MRYIKWVIRMPIVIVWSIPFVMILVWSWLFNIDKDYYEIQEKLFELWKV